MQLEDVLRIRESDEQVRQHRIATQHDVLFADVQHELKRLTNKPTEASNKLLDHIAAKLKEHNATLHT